ncbi:MAG: hypothetical protein A2580_08990 [Hydrogenophilales bacterium RIFOXYD1_FULL_62_11]|nr:MAG: hypothetical protein A2580_08990 [Hydrogenophilales bacterium RIFOXYD1_FULL_62_11]
MTLARQLYDLGDLKAVVRFDLKGKTAGWAILERKKALGTIRLNIEACRVALDDMLDDTIPHEIAHLVAEWTRRGHGHDEGWRRIAISLGSTGQRCHTLDLTPARKTRRFRYRATCGTEIALSSVRHNKLRKGKTFKLRDTGGILTASGLIGEAM